jgi:hypothetical protein
MVKSAFVRWFSSLLRFVWRLARVLATLSIAALLLTTSNLQTNSSTERVRAFTRNIEFDYVGWTLDALGVKWSESALGMANYLNLDVRKKVTLDYIDLVRSIEDTERDISLFYSDPNILNPQLASAPLAEKLARLKQRRDQIGPLAEAILQDQISAAADSLGLSLGGQSIPPVMYHSTELPLALIVSPRSVIRQDENISLRADLDVDQRSRLEDRVDSALDVSSLVVEIGGVGTYPTMVQQTSALDWLAQVVAHEWTHNFLTLRPLGVLYTKSPEMRVINETTASLAGEEIGRKVLQLYYPELVPPPPSSSPPPGTPPSPPPPVFDFRKEMHITRITVDQMLAEGKIDEAETYMENRRLIFWENGYRSIRKLNQAYFAFYGAYADQPGGASGSTEDPIGAAVRALRAQSPSLSVFLNRISWVTSYEGLQKLLEETPAPLPVSTPSTGAGG